MPDSVLVQAVVRGDHDAIGAVRDRYSRTVSNVLRACLGSDGGVEACGKKVAFAYRYIVARLPNEPVLHQYLESIRASR